MNRTDHVGAPETVDPGQPPGSSEQKDGLSSVVKIDITPRKSPALDEEAKALSGGQSVSAREIAVQLREKAADLRERDIQAAEDLQAASDEHMLMLNYEDRPGMIGRIGTIMGQHDINIASMNLGRREKKGEAMVILSLDSPVPAPVVDELKSATEASFIKALKMRAGACSRNCGCGV